MQENNESLDTGSPSVNVQQNDCPSTSEDKLCENNSPTSEIDKNVIESVTVVNQRDDFKSSVAFETGDGSVKVCQEISAEDFEDTICESEKISEVMNCECLEGSSKSTDQAVTGKDVFSIVGSGNEEGCVLNGNSEKEQVLGVNDSDRFPYNPYMESGVRVDETTTFDSATPNSMYVFDAHKTTLISRAWKEFRRKGKNSFLKGCKWAPDGSCILTNSEDKKLKIFDLPQQLYCKKIWPKNEVDLLPDLKKTVEVVEGGRVYDYCWYSLMNSWDPPSCCFVSSSTDEPVHLWDAFDGKLRATYQSRNYAEETMSPFSVHFSPDGEKLLCGFKNRVDIFSVMCPGIKPTSYNTKALTGQTGLVSTIAVNPNLPDLFAVGTFQKTVGLYSMGDKCGICVLNGHSGGLTHLMFSPDGSRLYTGSRMDPEIVCWDLRNPGKVLFSLYRNVTTNQRIYFDLTPDGKFLVSGNTDGCVSIWDLQSDKLLNGDVEPVEPDIIFPAHKDCANGVSINMRYPILASSSGQRHFPDILDDGDNDDQNSSGNFFDCDSLVKKKEDCINLWWIGPVS